MANFVEPYGINLIITGDIREIAPKMETGSVHCIICSPPYFGLRDYGTAEWEGGNPECDHRETDRRNSRPNGAFHGGNDEAQTHPYRDTCPKCGATRKDAQIGLEKTPQEYVETLVGIFRKLRRVLRDDGTVWLNLGDSYANTGNKGQDFSASKVGYGGKGRGHIGGQPTKIIPDGLKPKDLIGIPWRVALALQADGWYLRSDIIWHKKNPMPESVRDRPTKAHEYIFLLSKSPRYYYDQEAVKETSAKDSIARQLRGVSDCHKNTNGAPGQTPHTLSQSRDNDKSREVSTTRNRRTVWECATRPFKPAHFATFPPDLIRPCILAGCPAKACADCGAPWVRVVEVMGYEKQRWAPGEDQYHTQAKGKHGKTSAFTTGHVAQKETTGFRPTCTCDAGSAPGVVFDPFMGSGTVGEVAVEEGRNWLGVELNPDYVKLAVERIAGAKPKPPYKQAELIYG